MASNLVCFHTDSITGLVDGMNSAFLHGRNEQSSFGGTKAIRPHLGRYIKHQCAQITLNSFAQKGFVYAGTELKACSDADIKGFA